MFNVASWNMNQTESSWSFLDELSRRLGIQIFLLQEAHPYPSTPRVVTEPSWDDPDAWKLPVPVASRRNYCSAIGCADPALSLTPRRPTPLAEASYGGFVASHPGQFAMADVSVGESEPVTVVSLYGIWDEMIDSDDIYADATLHRAISDLTVIFQERGQNKILVAGDLNVWHGYDQAKTIKGWSLVWAKRFASVFERMDALGLELIGPFRPDGVPVLERCPCSSAECRHVNTYRHKRQPTAVPYQNDYMFATAALRERLARCYAVEYDDVWQHSDHRPVVAEFDL